MPKPIAVLCALLLCFGCARAEVEDFLGRWENPAKDESGIYHVVVTPAGHRRVNIRIYGDCRPGACDWGVTPADDYRYAPGTKALESVSATIHFGFAHRRITLQSAGKNRLHFSVAVTFVEGTGKRDIRIDGTLKRAGWIDIGNPNWEQPIGRHVGWGGGPRGHTFRQPEERCIPFEPYRLDILYEHGRWVVAADGKWLTQPTANKEDAHRALAIIRRYGFNRKCQTGTMDFWHKGKGFPAEDILGPSCMKFSSTTAHVMRVGKSWRVIDGMTVIADMNVSRDNAFAVLAMIRSNRLERKCVVAWPNVVMTYWLKAEH